MALENTKYSLTIVPAAAGVTTLNGTTLDMAGFDGVVFALSVGTITETGTVTMKAQHSEDGSSWADVAGATVSAADTNSDKLLLLEAVIPTKRYARCVVTRGVANSAIGGCVAGLYGRNRLHNTVSHDPAVAANNIATTAINAKFLDV